MKHLAVVSWLAFLLALAAWAAVIFFGMTVAQQEADRTVSLTAAQQSATVQYSSARMHALAQDSAPERAQLEGFLGSDVVTVVTALNSLGKAAGVSLKVSSAIPETAPSGTQNATSPQVVGISLEADGKFAALMRAIELLQTFPVPSSVSRLDMQRSPGTGDAWHLSVYTKVLMGNGISL